MTKHFEPEPFIDRDDIAAAIHRRPPMPCFKFVRARKMVVAYPSLKDRVRFHLGLAYGATPKKAATQCIAALGEPYGKRLLRPTQADRSAEPPALLPAYTAAVEKLTKAVEAADAVDTEIHYKQRALEQVDALCRTLTADRDFKVKKTCDDGVRELVKNGCGATPRIRMRWEQFPHNHSVALIEDFADAAGDADEAGRTAFTNFLTDAFTSLSEHLAGAPNAAHACSCPNRFACQPRERKCPNRGDRREALFRHLVPNDHAADPAQPKQPGFGQFVAADYWIVPLQSFVDMPKVKAYLIEEGKLTQCEIDKAVAALSDRCEVGLDGDRHHATTLKVIEGVAAWAKAWFKIRDYDVPGEIDAREERRDFVCSLLSHHRCLLLSDLRPDANGAGDRAYTEYESRSIIIDFGMHEEERGRVLQRLMDIAAFRQLGLRGLPYVRQATNTITRLGVTLNALNATATHGGKAKLRVIEQLTASMDLLNLFFTYGVTGRSESLARASLRVSKNVGLLREARIPGHQTLAGYLERYFWTANDIEVMRSRYANLRSRIDNAANLVKAEFERTQSESIAQLTRIAIPISAVAAIGAIMSVDPVFDAVGAGLAWALALLAWPTG